MAARRGSLGPLRRQPSDLPGGGERDHAGLVGHVVGHLDGIEYRKVIGVDDLSTAIPTELLDGLTQLVKDQRALASFGLEELGVPGNGRLELGPFVLELVFCGVVLRSRR